jgi:hypothetical protein
MVLGALAASVGTARTRSASSFETPQSSELASVAGSCSAPDLQSPGPAAMPLALRLTATETFPVATVTLTLPAPQDEPSVPPESAWDAALVQKRSDTRYEVVLARMSAEFPATMGVGVATKPVYQDILAWVVITHGIPMANLGGGTPAPGAVTTPRPPCFRADALDVTDATTGRHLLSSSFGSTG